ncbi:MAG: hypothetical protein JXA38_04080 [Methanosarcinaceae archaeon]|nr:hypothetical protein [Methanosarcinaceae archaeon]
MTVLDDLFNVTSPFDIVTNYYDLAESVTNGLFTMTAIPLIFFASWLLTGKVVLPATLFSIIGGFLLAVAPFELKKVALLMFVFGVGGLIYTWFKDR